jgi:hypothetical protein
MSSRHLKETKKLQHASRCSSRCCRGAAAADAQEATVKSMAGTGSDMCSSLRRRRHLLLLIPPRRGETDGGCQPVPPRPVGRASCRAQLLRGFHRGRQRKATNRKRKAVALCCAGCGNLLGGTVRFSNEHVLRNVRL